MAKMASRKRVILFVSPFGRSIPYTNSKCRQDDLTHFGVSKDGNWQPISKIADIDTSDQEKEP